MDTRPCHITNWTSPPDEMLDYNTLFYLSTVVLARSSKILKRQLPVSKFSRIKRRKRENFEWVSETYACVSGRVLGRRPSLHWTGAQHDGAHIHTYTRTRTHRHASLESHDDNSDAATIKVMECPLHSRRKLSANYRSQVSTRADM